MGEKKVIEALIEGGKATAGPPLGPALGPLGINVLMVVNKINELTKSYSGMKVPAKISVDVETKEFDVEIGTPSTSALIVKEAGIEKGSGNSTTQKVADLKMSQVVSIAKVKMPVSYSKELRGVVKEVLGACLSMGVTVEGRDCREIQREVDEGKWDDAFKKE